VAEALEVDVRPLATGSVQQSSSSADRLSVIGPISTPQGRPNEMRMNELQQLIDRGEYRVDTNAVADAILRRILATSGRPEAPQAGDQG
jgi:anti-sigma28 factor (negative regulator of flagellin synthesis)